MEMNIGFHSVYLNSTQRDFYMLISGQKTVSLSFSSAQTKTPSSTCGKLKKKSLANLPVQESGSASCQRFDAGDIRYVLFPLGKTDSS